MESSRDDRNAGSRLHAFRHFGSRVLGKRQQQDLFGFADSGHRQISGLGGNHAGLPRSRGSKYEGRVFVHDDREPLFEGQRLGFERIEEIIPSSEFGGDEGGDAGGAYCLRVCGKASHGRDARTGHCVNRLRPDLGQYGRIKRPGLFQQRRDFAGGRILQRRCQCPYAGDDRLQM